MLAPVPASPADDAALPRPVCGLQLASWLPWRSVLEAARGEDPEDAAIVRAVSGRSVLPTKPVRDLVVIGGRGSGKSRIAAALAAFYATTQRYELAPGERIWAIVVAPSRNQARITFGYTLGLLQSVEDLADLIENTTAFEIHLKTGVSIAVLSADYRTIRGRSACVVIIEEGCFLPSDESATPDTELLRALRPALGRVPGSLLVMVSSPWAQRGELFKSWRTHWGDAGSDKALVIRADTRTLNPTFDADVIAEAYADDPVSAATEFGAEWRSDVSTLFNESAVARCVQVGRAELPRQASVSYVAFLDFAGGSGSDSAAMAIAHRAGDVTVIDCVRERRPPFSPEDLCREFAETFKGYGVTSAQSDRWGGQFPVEQMAKFGISVTPCEQTKSDLYRAFVPVVNSGRIELLDDPRSLAQLRALERLVGAGGRENIDHPPGSHDDRINAIAGATAVAGRAGDAWLIYAREFVERAKREGTINEDGRVWTAGEGKVWP